MIWIVLVLAVLCIAVSCVALWYRKQWRFERELREALLDENNRLRSHLPKRDSKGRFCKK